MAKVETKTCYHFTAYPRETHIESITAPDRWTAIIKCLPGMTGLVYEFATQHSKMIPHEVVEKYGDLADWKNACGTGPFMLVDYVPHSSMTFERNPNYWQKDPFFPENQLPYLDSVKYLIIPDLSTRIAALRTGRIDWLGGMGAYVPWEDAENLMKTNPELKWMEYPSGSSLPAIYMRIDTKPFDDIRVRRALAMAIDNEGIKDKFYGGHAETYSWPILPIPEFRDVFIPFEQLPESVRELYGYHPERAKQLLAEAGYPDGFKTDIVCTAASVDLLSIYNAYWAKIGVDLELKVYEDAVATSIGAGKTHKQMYLGNVSPTIFYKMIWLRTGNYFNWSMIDDQRIMDTYKAVSENYFDEPKRNQLLRDIIPYLLDQTYILPAPAQNLFHMWWPWIKNYSGEVETGYASTYYSFPKYVFCDTDLKQNTKAGK